MKPQTYDKTHPLLPKGDPARGPWLPKSAQTGKKRKSQSL